MASYLDRIRKKAATNLAKSGATKSLSNLQTSNKAYVPQSPTNISKTTPTNRVSTGGKGGTTLSPEARANQLAVIGGTKGTGGKLSPDARANQLAILGGGGEATFPKKEVVPPPPDDIQIRQGFTPKENPMQEQILALLKQILDRPGFNFDPSSDPGYKASADAAANIAKQQMGRMGRLYSNTTDTRMSQAALASALPFRQQAYNEYKGEGDRLASQLSALNTLGQQDLQKYKSDYDYIQKGIGQQNVDVEKQREFKYAGEDRVTNLAAARDAKDIERHGFILPPSARQSVTVYENMPPQIQSQVSQFHGNYAQEINRLEATDPENPLLPYLYAARSYKIINDPQLAAKYGNDIGLESPKIQALAMQFEMQQLKNNIERAAYAQSQIVDPLKVQKINLEIDKLNSQKAQEYLKELSLPTKLENDFALQIADIANTYASAEASRARGRASDASAEASRASAESSRASAEKTRREQDREDFDYKGLKVFEDYIQNTFYQTDKVTGGGMLGGDETVSTSTNLKPGAKDKLTAYILGLKRDPNIDPNIVAALQAKHGIRIK